MPAAYCRSRFRCVLGAATGAALLACALPAASQVTAHFAYAESAVGQAAAGYRGVAVDGSYNVYLTASGGGSGHEVVRVPAADPQCTHQGCTVLDASDWPVPAGFSRPRPAARRWR